MVACLLLAGVGGAAWLLLGADSAMPPTAKSIEPAGADWHSMGTTWSNVSPEQLAEAERHQVPVAFTNPIGMRFVLIPGGPFLMGSPNTEPGRESDEGPQHVVTLAPFYLSIHETTNRQYRMFRPNHRSGTPNRYGKPEPKDPHGLEDDERPVLRISHQEATEFAAWISLLPPADAPRVCRLPSEAEWECACRAGTTARFFWSDDERDRHLYANIHDELDRTRPGRETTDGAVRTARVGAYMPNRWGLYDMLGNVFEWCADDYNNSYVGAPTDGSAWMNHPVPGRQRVLRGGSWGSPLRLARCAFRAADRPALRHDELGVRLAASLPSG